MTSDQRQMLAEFMGEHCNVSWGMEFLTYSCKISLILSKKLMGFKEIAVFYELT